MGTPSNQRERLALYLYKTGRKQQELADKIGQSKQNINRIVAGITTSGTAIEALCAEIGCSLAWLTSGVGDAPDWMHEDAEKQEKDGDDTLIPISGQVTCGDGWVHESQDPDDHAPVVIRAHWRAVRIQGRSAEPIVLPGQCVLVDDRLPVKDGRIVCVQTKDGRAYCKRFCRTDGHVVLAGLNAGIDSVALHSDEIGSIAVVVGTVYTDSVAR